MALTHTKSGTAVGYDNIAPEFLKHLGPLARCWLTKFLSHILEVRRTPRLWRRAKVIAILKSGKDPKSAASYRPISLLSVCFKVLKRIILGRIIICRHRRGLVSGPGRFQTRPIHLWTGAGPVHVHWERLPAESQDRCCFRGPNNGVNYDTVWQAGL